MVNGIRPTHKFDNLVQQVSSGVLNIFTLFSRNMFYKSILELILLLLIFGMKYELKISKNQTLLQVYRDLGHTESVIHTKFDIYECIPTLNNTTKIVSLSVHRIRYIPYKSNMYTGVLRTWTVRFAPNLIFRLIYQL